MRVNRHLPHLFILPEDDATAQIANGFVLHLNAQAINMIRILPQVGGWLKVVDNFSLEQVAGMQRFSERLIVLVIDFDNDTKRLEQIRKRIPAELAERVFVLGALDEAESLKPTLGSLEAIGEKLAGDCESATQDTWAHKQLQHNSDEVKRLCDRAGPILFPTS